MCCVQVTQNAHQPVAETPRVPMAMPGSIGRCERSSRLRRFSPGSPFHQRRNSLRRCLGMGVA
jgi:hypothetical protein